MVVLLMLQMEHQRKNSGAEQEQFRQQLQKAQESIKAQSKEMKDIKSKLSQVSFMTCYNVRNL